MGRCVDTSWTLDTNRCDTGWSSVAGSAVSGTVWNEDTARCTSGAEGWTLALESAICQTPSWTAWTTHHLPWGDTTPIIIACPDTNIGISESTSLSVSGGTSPYSWYVTGGTGTISAHSSTISAVYTSTTMEETATVAALDYYYAYDDQPIVVINEVVSAALPVGFSPQDLTVSSPYVYVVGFIATPSAAGDAYNACILKCNLNTFAIVASATFSGDRATDSAWNSLEGVAVCGSVVYGSGKLSRYTTAWSQAALLIQLNTSDLSENWRIEAQYQNVATDTVMYGREVYCDGSNVYWVGNYSIGGGLGSRAFRLKASTAGVSAADKGTVYSSYDALCQHPTVEGTIIIGGSAGGNRMLHAVSKTAWGGSETEYQYASPNNCYEHLDIMAYGGEYYACGNGKPVPSLYTMVNNFNLSYAEEWGTYEQIGVGIYNYYFKIAADSTGIYCAGRHQSVSAHKWILGRYNFAGTQIWRIIDTESPTTSMFRTMDVYNNQIIMARYESASMLNHDRKSYIERRSQDDGSLII